MSDLDQNPQPTEPNEPVEQSLLGGQPTEPQVPSEPTEPVDQPEVINSIDDYKVEVDGFNYDDFKAIPENQEFLERAKEAGLDNKTLNFALKEYNDIIQNVVGANTVLDAEACTAEMKQAWGADADANFKAARDAANLLVNSGIATVEEVNSPENGNNPFVLKMAAFFGKQLQEDAPPSHTQQSGSDSIEQLMMSEAYSDANHPEHKAVAAKVSAFFQKTTPE